MANLYKQLGQLRPADTTAASLYSPSSGSTARLIVLFVCNLTGAGVAFRIFHDRDGTTYDQTTALYYDVTQAANTTSLIDLKGLYMNNSSGNIAVRSATNDAFTFTLYGIEYSKYEQIREVQT